MMPSRDYFVMIAKSLDIRKSHTVVVYDGQQGAFACRGAFMLKAFGHPDVRILDGGLAKWKKEGKEVRSRTAATAEDFSYELRSEGIKSYEDIVAIEKNGSA
jgi:thiosulfate/3-mercaptopyruvate sulfurtransferase